MLIWSMLYNDNVYIIHRTEGSSIDIFDFNAFPNSIRISYFGSSQFIHILKGCITDTEPLIPQCQWSNGEKYGKTGPHASVDTWWHTVETLYSTIYYSKYFIELNFDKSTQYVALWTHKRHHIPRPIGRAMECLLWVLQQKLTVL